MPRRTKTPTTPRRKRAKRQPQSWADPLESATTVVNMLAKAGEERLHRLLNAIAESDSRSIGAF